LGALVSHFSPGKTISAEGATETPEKAAAITAIANLALMKDRDANMAAPVSRLSK
jgi:hypothetical protein